MPLLSVIIPVYNREALVGRTIESALRQDISDYEVIVVDDGSTDRSAQVAGRYDGQVQLVRQANAGEGAARNAGVRLARGKYVAFLDSDDLWFPWTLRVFVDVINAHHSPSLILGRPTLFRDEAELAEVNGPGRHISRRFQDLYTRLCQGGLWLGAGGTVIRRDVIMRIGGHHTKRFNAPDTDLLLKAGTAPGFVELISPPTFAYRQHSGNVAYNVVKGSRGIGYILSREKRGEYPGGTTRRRERRQIVGAIVQDYCRFLLSRGEVMRGLRLYWNVLPLQLPHGSARFLFGYPLEALAPLPVLRVLAVLKRRILCSFRRHVKASSTYVSARPSTTSGICE